MSTYSFIRATDYDANSDGSLSTSEFSTLLTALGTTNKKYLLVDMPCNVGTCTISSNVVLKFVDAGKFVFQNGVTVAIHAQIDATHEKIFENASEIAANLPTVKIHRQEYVSPMWWGGKMSGDNADATTNYNAFRSAWNAVARSSQTLDGGSIRFPAGTFIMNGMTAGSDGFSTTCKYANIVGSGRSKTTIMLASGQNKSLLDIVGNFDLKFQDLAFDGNAASNTTMTSALISITYYRVDFIDCAIRNCTADGILISGSVAQANSIQNPLIYNVVGIGIKLVDVINVAITGLIDIESTGTGVYITGTNTTMYDSRYNSRVSISGSWYGESLGSGVVIKGIGGVRVNVNIYARYVTNIVNLQYDTNRGMPSCWNMIDIRSSRDEKGINQMGIVIDDKNCYNIINIDPGTNYTDSDGRNSINGANWSEHNVLGNVKTSTVYNDNTNPTYNTISSGGSRVAGGSFNDAISHNSTFNYPSHVLVAGYCSTYTTTYFQSTNTHYILCRVKGTPGGGSYVRLGDTGSSYRYDFARKTWIAVASWSLYNNQDFIFPLNGRWQTFIIPINPRATNEYYSAAMYKGNADSFEIDYVAFIDNENSAFIHKLSNTIIGYNDDALFTNTSIPPANEVSVGTRVFLTNLGLDVISNGTNWKKPDGTNL